MGKKKKEKTHTRDSRRTGSPPAGDEKQTRAKICREEGRVAPKGGREKVAARARPRERQAAAASQDEADESDATEEEATGGRTMRVGRPRGGMKVAARIGEGLRREIERGRRPRVGVADG